MYKKVCGMVFSGPFPTFIDVSTSSLVLGGEAGERRSGCRWKDLEEDIESVWDQKEGNVSAHFHDCDFPVGLFVCMSRTTNKMGLVSDMKHLHTVVFCLCVLGGVCVRLGGGQGLLVLQIGLHQRRLLQRQLFTRVRPVLDIYDPVVSLESLP